MTDCQLEEMPSVTVRLDQAGRWQLARIAPDGFPLDGMLGGITCTIHGDRIPAPKKCRLADRDLTIPPLPTLAQLHELIGETLRQQGFARAQAVIDAGEAP